MWGNISSVCDICIFIGHIASLPLKLITPQDPVPPPAPHNNRLSYISLPGDRSLSSLSSGRGPGHLREAQHQGRGREPGAGRAARPSSTYEMLSSGQRSSSHQARLQPLVRWGTLFFFLQTLVVIVRPDTRSESKYRISMTECPVLNHRIESQFGAWLIFCSHENKWRQAPVTSSEWNDKSLLH